MQTTMHTDETLSGVLQSALDTDQDGQVTVGEIVDRVAERGFGLLLILLALPMLVPMPPGTSGPVGLLFALLGGQMMFGRTRPWLPCRARAYRLSPKAVRALQRGGVGFLRRVERFSRPRLDFAENPLTRRAIALLIVLMGIMLFLPLPFMNTLPSFLLLLVGIGFLNRDGLFLLAGSLLCLALLLFLLFSTHLLAGWIGRLFLVITSFC
jgi:hypothetical protein